MIGESVRDLLAGEHYAVDWVRDGESADTALRAHAYDLVLLDLGLPRRDGLDVLRALRARKDRVPVLIATARDSVRARTSFTTHLAVRGPATPRRARGWRANCFSTRCQTVVDRSTTPNGSHHGRVGRGSAASVSTGPSLPPRSCSPSGSGPVASVAVTPPALSLADRRRKGPECAPGQPAEDFLRRVHPGRGFGSIYH